MVHGDVYTQSKLHRFGLADTDKCPRCDEIEDLKHKVLECQYTKKIWRCAYKYLEKLQGLPGQNLNQDHLKTALAANLSSNLASMTYSAELLQTILYLKPDQLYLIHPKVIALRALKNIGIKEGNAKIKELFIEVLNEVDNNL